METEPITRLIAKYSIPTALTLMVNYLYNIVDQIFVGQGVGVTGMAATNVAFPLTIIAIAIALLIGDGCAANISLCLGRKQQEMADRTVSHAVTLLIASGVVILLLCSILAPQIVTLFGSTDTAFQSSLTYTRTIAWGLLFLMFSSALTAIIRADGNPQYTMKCMMVGAAINLVLDPISLFGLKMGVFWCRHRNGYRSGGGRFALLCLCEKTKDRAHLKICFKAHLATYSADFGAGISSLLTQIMTAVVQITMNNLMTIYGAQSVYGSDTALSAYGMMMKVYQIAHSMFVGVSSATQPINGYNFGAKLYDRVKQTYKLAAVIALIVSVVWFAIYQLFSKQIGMLFVSGDALYADCAQHIFRIYMMAFFLYGLHMVTASFLQGIGKPVKALLIPLSRQAIFLIPLAIILSGKFGLDGALFAAPIADTLVFVLSLALAAGEFRSWKHQQIS